MASFDTRILTGRGPADRHIALCAEALLAGQPIAFPTETVYGLGAICQREADIRRVFEIKGRPLDNPLIVHLASLDELPTVAREIPSLAYSLFEVYCPGPLTLVLKRHERVPAVVSAGLNTVAVRWPQHPLASDLIRAVGAGLVAPSANQSGRPSPSTAAHVFTDLATLIPYVLDGGPCHFGLESTVLDLTSDPVAILRPGAYSPERLAEVIGYAPLWTENSTGEQPRAPGMKYRHYAPRCPVEILETGNLRALLRFAAEGRQAGELRAALISEKLAEACSAALGRDFLPWSELERAEAGDLVVLSYRDATAAAHELFSFFRAAEPYASSLLVEAAAEGELAAAFNNRLAKAAAAR